MAASDRAKLEKCYRITNYYNPRTYEVESCMMSRLLNAFESFYLNNEDRLSCINDLVTIAFECYIWEDKPEYRLPFPTPIDVIRCKLYVNLQEKFAAYCDFRDDSVEFKDIEVTPPNI